MSKISWSIIDDPEYRYIQTIKKKDGNKLGKRKRYELAVDRLHRELRA